MAIQDGKLYFVSKAGATFSGQTTGTMDAEANMIEITTKDSAGYREYMAGLKGGTVSCDAMQDWSDSDGFSRAFEQLVAGTAGQLYFGQAAGTGGMRMASSALISSISLTGGNDEAAGYSITFQLTGLITEVATS